MSIMLTEDVRRLIVRMGALEQAVAELEGDLADLAMLTSRIAGAMAAALDKRNPRVREALKAAGLVPQPDGAPEPEPATQEIP